MAIIHHMIEERIDLEHGSFLMMARVEISENEPKFATYYEIRSSRKIECSLEVQFIATNPLGIDDVIIGTATAYGLCVAAKLTRKTAKEAIKCYRKSKRDNPNYSIIEHAKAAGACVAGKGSIMKDTATDALIDCLNLPKDDDDKDDDVDK